MNIYLQRIRYKKDTIDGILKIDGVVVAHTAENAHHALKQGEYPITSTGTFRRYALMGNGVYNIRSQSFIVGKYLIPGVVTKSAFYYKRIYERVRKALRRKQRISLIIVDAK
ncbi:MAG: hypothetical protein ACI3ZD_04605 [Prevotella sp.]